MSTSIYIFLNSDDRTTGEPHQPVFNLSSIASSNLLNYKLSLSTLEFPNSVYAINSVRNNNFLYFQEAGSTAATYSGTFTETEYTGATFATEVQSILNNNTGNAYTYTVSYSSTTKKLTISEGSNNQFRIVTGDSTAHREVGWDVVNVTDFKTAAYELSAPIDISGTKYIDVVSSIGNLNVSSSYNSNIIFRCPVNSSFGDIIFYQNTDNSEMYISHDDFSEIRLDLRDDRGRPFQLPHNASASFVLRLSQ